MKSEKNASVKTLDFIYLQEIERGVLYKIVPPLPAAGYFMIRTKGGWQRLVVMTPADLVAVDMG